MTLEISLVRLFLQVSNSIAGKRSGAGTEFGSRRTKKMYVFYLFAMLRGSVVGIIHQGTGC